MDKEQDGELIIKHLINTLRPFAKVAEAQKHTDCGGVLTQTDWENAAQCVAAYEEDVARQKHGQ